MLDIPQTVGEVILEIPLIFLKYIFTYPVLEVTTCQSLQVPRKKPYYKLVQWLNFKHIAENLNKNYGIWMLQGLKKCRWGIIFFSFPISIKNDIVSEERELALNTDAGFYVKWFHTMLIDGLLGDLMGVFIDTAIDRIIATELSSNSEYEIYQPFDVGNFHLLMTSLLVEWSAQFAISQIYQGCLFICLKCGIF